MIKGTSTTRTGCLEIPNIATTASANRTAVLIQRTSQLVRNSSHTGVRVAKAITGIASSSSTHITTAATTAIPGKRSVEVTKGPCSPKSQPVAAAAPATTVAFAALKTTLFGAILRVNFDVVTATAVHKMSQEPGSSISPINVAASVIVTA